MSTVYRNTMAAALQKINIAPTLLEMVFNFIKDTPDSSGYTIARALRFPYYEVNLALHAMEDDGRLNFTKKFMQVDSGEWHHIRHYTVPLVKNELVYTVFNDTGYLSEEIAKQPALLRAPLPLIQVETTETTDTADVTAVIMPMVYTNSAVFNFVKTHPGLSSIAITAAFKNNTNSIISMCSKFEKAGLFKSESTASVQTAAGNTRRVKAYFIAVPEFDVALLTAKSVSKPMPASEDAVPTVTQPSLVIEQTVDKKLDTLIEELKVKELVALYEKLKELLRK
jgi:hypothetical protein